MRSDGRFFAEYGNLPSLTVAYRAGEITTDLHHDQNRNIHAGVNKKITDGEFVKKGHDTSFQLPQKRVTPYRELVGCDDIAVLFTRYSLCSLRQVWTGFQPSEESIYFSYKLNLSL